MVSCGSGWKDKLQLGYKPISISFQPGLLYIIKNDWSLFIAIIRILIIHDLPFYFKDKVG